MRLIGVDTPETVHPGRAVEFFGREASAFTKRLLEGRRVRLEYDRERTDRYERRTLAYVHLADGTFANAEIVRQGYGHAYTRFPFRHLDPVPCSSSARRAPRAEGLWVPVGVARRLRGAGQAAGRVGLRWDDNGNGRVSCAEARRHWHRTGPRAGHPAYAYMRDGDGDGVVCE